MRRERDRVRVVNARAVVLAILMMAPAGARAATTLEQGPQLSLPPWVAATLTLDHPPEAGHPAHARFSMRALLVPLPDARYEIELPHGARVEGAAAGPTPLTTTQTTDVVVEFELGAPAAFAHVSAAVITHPPRGALAAEIDRLYANDHARHDSANRSLRELPREERLVRSIEFSSSADEASLASSPDPVYRHYLDRGGPQYVLLDALPGMDVKALEAKRADAKKRRDTLAPLLPGKGKNPLLRVVTDLDLELAKVAYQRAVIGLAEGQAHEARVALSRDDEWAKLPATLALARSMALAVATALDGDAAGAAKLWDALAARIDARGALRYVEYNRGELARASGDTTRARYAYLRALELAPSFTRARNRLGSLR